MDRGAWWTTVHGVADLDTTGQLTLNTSVLIYIDITKVLIK